MKTAQDILKFTALLYLLTGSLLVFIPIKTNIFLNEILAIPDVIILLGGIGLNISGLLFLHMTKQQQLGQLMKLTLNLIQLLWIIAATITLLLNAWITTINGITVTGLWIILCSWLLWHFYQIAPFSR
ncbi:MAG: hypothetical protein R3E90_09725 [Marinicella sp.]|nr:hypothetical protein [Xanthomonadales bacterium]